MDRAQILADMGIDTWIRKRSNLAESINSGVDIICSDGTGSDKTSPDYPKQRGRDSKDIPLTIEQPQMGQEATVAEISGSTDSIEVLRTDVIDCQQCQLCESRTQAVPSVGNPKAKWLFIGEAPGAEEDRQGEPFVGRAGQLLDNIFRALGVPRKDVYISNVLKCHPPGNRNPKSKEIDACRAFLYRELQLVQPDVVVALGDIAVRELLQNDMPIDKLRGTVHRIASVDIPCVVTYHPTGVLREPDKKMFVWEDLLLAKTLISDSSEPDASITNGH